MQRATRRRTVILELLEESAQFLGAQQIHRVLADRGQAMALATVYRALQALTDSGDLDVLRSEEGEHLYRRCPRRDRHHHLVCRACGAAVDLPGGPVEDWVAGLAREHGFVAVTPVVEFHGLCASCLEARGPR
ncbi:transcriptional repressor [Kocuria dechangensis]|uniref:Transcriptional repressor n=1 Tax=Kocuria dechangensis TaxID=1176249 RepID=A0A917LWH7_9MICC|nr:Fur family transcriptional regulator [Kocuria dechangensis]GGG62487.1 transcriptional repressor [Kocuria dechangensis]